jgi:hypothetical protein
MSEEQGIAIWEESRANYAQRLSKSLSMFEAFLQGAYGLKPTIATPEALK